MKTLVIIAHPDIETSRVNRQWTAALASFPEQFTLHHLYEQYPGWHIDVAAEQALAEAHDNIIMQFPFYWFNCPPMLRKWYDDVLMRGWAYGTGGDKLNGKKLMLAISCGVPEEEFGATGKYQYTVEELIRPFELTASYCGLLYQPPFIAHGMGRAVSEERIAETTQQYLQHIATIFGAPVVAQHAQNGQ